MLEVYLAFNALNFVEQSHYGIKLDAIQKGIVTAGLLFGLDAVLTPFMGGHTLHDNLGLSLGQSLEHTIATIESFAAYGGAIYHQIVILSKQREEKFMIRQTQEQERKREEKYKTE